MKYLEYRERRRHGTFDFPIAYYRVDPSHPRYNMPYHWHTECELVRIAVGEFLLTLNGSKIKLKKGDIVFIHGGMLHGGIPVDCVYECIVFEVKSLFKENNICARQMRDIFARKRAVASVLPADTPGLQATCGRMFDAMSQKKRGYEFMVIGSLHQLFGIIMEHELFDSSEEFTRKFWQRLDHFKDVLSIIEQEYPRRLTLDRLSAYTGLSGRQFRRHPDIKPETSGHLIDQFNFTLKLIVVQCFSYDHKSVNLISLIVFSAITSRMDFFEFRARIYAL